jgi:hypothetical protein
MSEGKRMNLGLSRWILGGTTPLWGLILIGVGMAYLAGRRFRAGEPVMGWMDTTIGACALLFAVLRLMRSRVTRTGTAARKKT